MQFVFLFFLWPLLSRLFKNIIISLMLIIAMTAYGFIAYSSHEAITNSLICFGYAIPLMALRYGVMLLMKKDSVFNINPENLREGLILTESYFKKVKTNAPDFYKETFGQGIYPEGLTAMQAAALKKHIASGKNDIMLPIEARKGKAFAEWIIFGAILTCLLGGGNVLKLFSVFMDMYIAK